MEVEFRSTAPGSSHHNSSDADIGLNNNNVGPSSGWPTPHPGIDRAVDHA